MKRPRILFALSLGCLLAAGATPVAGGSDGFGTVSGIIVEDVPDVSAAVTDVATHGDRVLVTIVSTQYDEGGDVTGRTTFLGESTDGGFAFSSTELADAASPRVEVCPGIGAALTGIATDDGRRVAGVLTDSGGRTIPRRSASANASLPDIACAGTKRLAVAYLSTAGGKTRLFLQTYRPDLQDAKVVGFDLGPATKGSAPAIAAVGGRIHVAWVKGSELRFQRFTVGDGPKYRVTALPRVTIHTSGEQRNPRLAAAGDRVVLAWERGADVVARVSKDKGASFRKRRVVIRGDAADLKVGVLSNVDVVGSTAMVSGTVVSEGIIASGRIRMTTDDGASWETYLGSERLEFVSGALGGTAADVVVHLVRDDRFNLAEQRVIHHRTDASE